jgi:hypothetical protein
MLTMPNKRKARLTPDEQQALMRSLDAGMKGKQAEATKAAQAADEAPPAKRGRPKKS